MPADLSPSLAEQWLFFEQESIAAILLPPIEFSAVEATVGRLRAAAFRDVSPFAQVDSDLDGRDHHYWHLLICDQRSGELLGAQRLSFSLWQRQGWGSEHSYLEHCYPGIASCFVAADLPYLEVGRVFVAPQARRNLQVLPALIRASGLLARATGHRYVLGLMSYRAVAPESTGDWLFLDRICRPPYTISLPLPPARHPLQFPLSLPQMELPPPADADLQACVDQIRVAELTLGRIGSAVASLRLPGLIRIYNRFTRARVAGLSIARDFNQIVEILMANDLHDHSQGANHPGLCVPHRRPWLMAAALAGQGSLQAPEH